MLPMLFHQWVPASLRGGGTGYALLAELDRQLHLCRSPEAAIDTLDNFKMDLYRRLAARFPVPVAQALTLKTFNVHLAKYHYEARSVSLLSPGWDCRRPLQYVPVGMPRLRSLGTLRDF